MVISGAGLNLPCGLVRPRGLSGFPLPIYSIRFPFNLSTSRTSRLPVQGHLAELIRSGHGALGRFPIVLFFRQHRPDHPGHLVRKRYSDQHSWFAL